MKRLFVVLIVLVLCMGLTMGCQNTPSEPVDSADSTDAIPDDPMRLRLGYSGSDNSANGQSMRLFAELVEEKTGGKVTIQTYSSDSISGGDQPKGIEMLMQGSADMTSHSNLIWSSIDQKFNAPSLPFAFDDYEEVNEIMLGEGGEAIGIILNEYGVKYLGFMDNGFRELTTSGSKITSMEDLKGLTVRINASQLQISLFKNWGADPTAMNWGEVFTALQQGTIDGQEVPINSLYTSNVYEVQDYLHLWDYMYDCYFLGINMNTFNGFSDELKQIIVDSASEATEKQRELVRSSEEEYIGLMQEKGITVVPKSEIDMDSLMPGVEALYQEYTSIIGEDLMDIFTK